MIKQGQEIITKSGKIRAIVTGACVRGNNTLYEIAYFSGSSYHQYWLQEFEFDVDQAEKRQPDLIPLQIN